MKWHVIDSIGAEDLCQPNEAVLEHGVDINIYIRVPCSLDGRTVALLLLFAAATTLCALLPLVGAVAAAFPP